jgi:phosphotransferase system enzyme I (PtsI)
MKKGIAASKGYAIGNVVLKVKEEETIVERKIDNLDSEKERLQKALTISRDQLERIKDKAEAEMGAEKPQYLKVI